MYKANIRSNFSGTTIQKNNTKLKSPEETVSWLNDNLGFAAPIDTKNENRILTMEPNSKIGFKVAGIQITITRK